MPEPKVEKLKTNKTSEDIPDEILDYVSIILEIFEEAIKKYENQEANS